ncbi:MAG TPA: circadian clock protein KaiC [Microvirga sp.]|jgi:circadian clock protein KaiC|nr:circadian clock protein KaiC [Microvirga sp.]
MTISKMHTGIPGLDAITHGGLPMGRLTLVTGDTGSGKTILGLQTLVQGVGRFDEPGVFVSFEEPPEEVAAHARGFGWRVVPWSGQQAAPGAGGAIPAIDACPSPDTMYAGQFDLSGLLAALTAAVERTSAKRVVLDGLDVLLDLLDDPRQRRREILRIADWSRTSRTTTVITAKEAEAGGAQEGYEFLKYMVSSAIVLKLRPQEGGSERTVRVLKMRGSRHSSAEHPLIIRDSGIVIGDVGSNRRAYEAPAEHVSSGVGRLDTMLGGGYHRGSSILISGAPGTSKTTLGGAFIDAACSRGERGLLISFDEAFAQIERNLASVNIHLQRHVDSGLLATAGLRTGRLSAEEHFHQIIEMVEAHRPDALVIDPISALDKVVGQELAGDLAERLIDEAKGRSITILMTSLLESANGHQESTKAQISSIADTWIQLSFAIQNGERNRALTIIKSRGNDHSNQVRELVLSDQGITLVDVYAQGGALLMGTARLEREQTDRMEEEAHRREAELAEQEVRETEARLRARQQEIEAELKTLERRRQSLQGAEAARQSRRDEVRQRLLELRHADIVPSDRDGKGH